MRIGLVIPPSAFLLDARVFINLGILKVAAALEANRVPVEVLDLSGIANYQDAFQDYLKTSPDAVGFTATTPQMPYVMELAEAARKAGVRTIIGGPHPTLVVAAAKKEEKRGIRGRAHAAFEQMLHAFDTTIAGDGEKSILEACSPLAPALVDADDPKGPLWMKDEDLIGLMPARHLVDLNSYHYSVDGERATSLIGQLGCPFQCAFCGGRASPMLRRSRVRKVEDIIAEMTHLHDQHGYKGFMFYDDELNVSKSMPQLMDAITALAKSRKTEFRLRGFIKAELFTEPQAAAMARAGFRWILVGFESGSPRILKNIRKQATVQHNTRCLEIAKRHGLKVKALMSLGHAGESRATIEDTQNWLLQQRVDDFDATIITTYPGTPYYDDAVETADGIWTYTAENGDKLHAYALDYGKVSDYYKGDPNQGYRAYVYTDELSSEELVTLRGQVEETVRRELGIPFYPAAPALQYEHSMGQTGLPASMLRSSTPDASKGVGT